MEAYEALIAGVLGLAALYAWQRRRDPSDKWLALVALWICVTGSVGMVLAQMDDPWRYIRLALRLSGPPLLLVICEESVRTSRTPGSRRTSLTFATFIWVLAVGALIYYRGGSFVELQIPFLGSAQVGVTAWMAMLAICFFSALLTIVPAVTRRVNPGFAGIAATLILFSESWAAVDPRWGSGVLSVSESVTYRSLLTFVLALIGIAKAHVASHRWLMSGAALDPPVVEWTPAKKSEQKKTGTPTKASPKASGPVADAATNGTDDEADGSDDEPREQGAEPEKDEARPSTKPAAKGSKGSGRANRPSRSRSKKKGGR